MSLLLDIILKKLPSNMTSLGYGEPEGCFVTIFILYCNTYRYRYRYVQANKFPVLN
jgi:hypothetical protein